jgi:hypothetical protein
MGRPEVVEMRCQDRLRTAKSVFPGFDAAKAPGAWETT